MLCILRLPLLSATEEKEKVLFYNFIFIPDQKGGCPGPTPAMFSSDNNNVDLASRTLTL